jgi:hypothetical protein
LQCELTVVSADVFQFDWFAGVMRLDPFPVFFIAVNSITTRARVKPRRDRIGAANVDLAHMRDVKQPGVITRAQVFFDCSGGIPHGHIPAAKVDHTITQLPVGGASSEGG